MTGEEMIREIERREYYAERERKNAELVECMVYAMGVIVTLVCLGVIVVNLAAVWRAFNPL